MEDQTNNLWKNIWIAGNDILLSVGAASWMAGFENISGVCWTLLMLLSFPMNMLFGWLFFLVNDLNLVPVLMLLMGLMFGLVGYFQWFVLAPRLVRFIKSFFSRDLEIDVNLQVKDTKQLAEAKSDWQTNWFDEHNHSPVERVLRHDPK